MDIVCSSEVRCCVLDLSVICVFGVPFVVDQLLRELVQGQYEHGDQGNPAVGSADHWFDVKRQKTSNIEHRSASARAMNIELLMCGSRYFAGFFIFGFRCIP